MNTLPEHYELIIQGITARDEKDFSKALELLSNAEEYSELRAVAYYEQGVTYFTMNNFVCSKRLLNMAIEQNPSSVPFRLFLADMFVDENNYQEAQECVEKALQLDPTCTYAHQVMLRMLSEKDGPEGEYNYFRKALTEYNNDLELLYDFSFLIINTPSFRSKDLLREALGNLLKIKERGFDDESLDYHIGKVYFLLCEDEKSIEYFEAYLKERKLDDPYPGKYHLTLFVEDDSRQLFEEHKSSMEQYGDLLYINSLKESLNGTRESQRGRIVGD